ncbi:MAG: hypothetical protein B7Y86_14045 [Brevundimonas subvibrioides]|uniref:DUF2975 domain-containing protein n=1 Tax=Brevundimonas subvibrioides TaxID=74313 RepID=A0A258HFT5_9CAUL|nr:DUF2975 domain-containing protein [Brevundimonas subvibrioides]OYX55202.1 MAG: hypothetical protein B7Y86_14045 [Brevundimonas subvibrioides]
MKLIGRRSVASVLRWVLGFVNIVVAFAVIATGLMLAASLVMPDFGAGFIDALADNEAGWRTLMLNERATFLAAFVATLSTWWILNRLRRMFLAVNQGDAFERANVGRLQGVGLGLIGVQISAFILAWTVPEGIIDDLDYSVDLGAWLGILIVFMLAEVFRQGAAMRDDQQMTV